MFFFSKRNKIVLDCFTSKPHVKELFPVQHSSKFLPDWWKRVDSSRKLDPVGYYPTIKKCAGFLNYFSESITIPLWSDLEFSFISDIQTQRTSIYWKFSDEESVAEASPHEQRGDYLNPDEYAHIKVRSPWFFRCKEDINWLFMQNTWVSEKTTFNDFFIPPGVVSYKYQHATHINMMLPYDNKTPKRFVVENGTPLVTIFPLSEKKIEIKTHVVDDKELEKIYFTHKMISFDGTYNKIKKILKDKETKKCPFGFGK